MSKNWLLTRRGVFYLGLGTLAGMGALAKSKALNNQARDFTVVGETSLKERATAKGLIYGAAAKYSTLSSDAEFTARFTQECAILVPENELKWGTLRPSPQGFDFTIIHTINSYHGMSKCTIPPNHTMIPCFHTMV